MEPGISGSCRVAAPKSPIRDPKPAPCTDSVAYKTPTTPDFSQAKRTRRPDPANTDSQMRFAEIDLLKNLAYGRFPFCLVIFARLFLPSRPVLDLVNGTTGLAPSGGRGWLTRLFCAC